MFLPPKRHAIKLATCLLAVLCCFGETTEAQDAEYNRRIAAMRQARARTQQPAQSIVTASLEADPATLVNQAPPQSAVRSASAEMPAKRSIRAAVNPRSRRGFLPRHVRMAQLGDGSLLDGGAPLVENPILSASSGTISGSAIVDGQVIAEPFVDGQIVEGCVDGSCDGCASCGEIGSYFDDDCCGRGGCPPGTPCWLDGLGTLFRNAEFYSGFTSFRSTLFNSPLTNSRELVNDCSHGYYGGVNVGIPLCRLTCGLLSGQFGMRTVNTNFNGSAFTNDDRNQVFFTAGLYRRVDYGLQFGVVADVLREEWFANSDLVQIRGDVGYVWPAGTSFGFRFATNVQDDVVNGTFNGVAFTNMIVATDDNYRFYLRHDAARGGFGEIFAGWSESDQGIIGMDFDMPLTSRVALEAGFTYYLNDDGVPANVNVIGGNQGQAFNTYVGFSFRPRGRSWFKSYDRPLFDVADNGSMLTIR